MAVQFRERLTREDIRRERDVLFVFGDNEGRYGGGGQARECRGEPNAVGVATKRLPARHEAAYWREEERERCFAVIDADLEPVFLHVRRGGTVVFPRDGIGTGRAELQFRAPSVMAHIRNRVRELMRLARKAGEP